MAEEPIYYEDIAVGGSLQADGFEVTKSDIVAFGSQFDPRAIHTDEKAAQSSIFGGLVASGIHNLAAWNRLRYDAEAGLVQLAGLGLDELRYQAPVRPGDRLHLTAECIEKRRSLSNADRGIMRFRHRLLSQHDEEVMTLIVSLLVARRPDA